MRQSYLAGGRVTHRESDIAVIGAGPAGLMAAMVAAQAGASVTLFEERDWVGGRLGLQTQPLQGPRTVYQGRNGVEFCRLLVDEAISAGVEMVLNTSVASIHPEGRDAAFGLTLKNAGKPGRQADENLRTASVVLATGSNEPWMEFPGSTLSGVILSGDAQEMLNVRGVLPGRRVVMVGSDNAGLLIAANLLEAGAEVVAVADESPGVLGREFNAAPLRDAGVEILTSTRVVEALGQELVESATIAHLDANLAPGTKRSLDVDMVCLAGPRAPESRLAALAGCSLRETAIMGGVVPVHDRRMATSVPGHYVCGDASGVENGAVSLESGQLAGLWAAKSVGRSHPQFEPFEKLARARLGYLRRGRRGLLRRKAKAAQSSEHRCIERIGT